MRWEEDEDKVWGRYDDEDKRIRGWHENEVTIRWWCYQNYVTSEDDLSLMMLSRRGWEDTWDDNEMSMRWEFDEDKVMMRLGLNSNENMMIWGRHGWDEELMMRWGWEDWD